MVSSVKRAFAPFFTRVATVAISVKATLGRLIRREGPALAAGVVASLAATLLMLGLRLVAGITTLPELLAERILPKLNVNLFLLLLVLIGKIPALGFMLLGQVVLGVLLAPAYVRLSGYSEQASARWPGRREWLAAGAISGGMWLVAAVIFWPKLGENLVGYPVPTARAITLLGLAAIFGLYGMTLVIVCHALGARLVARGDSAGSTRSTGPANVERRTVLKRSAIVAGAGLAVGGLDMGALLRALLIRSTVPYDGTGTVPAVGGTVAAITPTTQFFAVTKNVIDPAVVLSNWRLEIGGLVARPGSYDLPGLQSLPQEARAVTLECVSNPVGGNLISTAVWRGVLLASVLRDRGGTVPGGTHLLFTAVDGYQAGQPLAELLDIGTLLAWEMNGVPLPQRHGYPLRAVIPNYYGEHSPKWLTRIEVVDHQVLGFYQEQGWKWGPLHTMSRIDTPARNARVPLGPVHVAGIAFAGTRGIRAVEVSADGGQSWQPAALAPAPSMQSWVQWSWKWTPRSAGAYTLVVRATDGTGALQTAKQQDVAPAGATGYHRVPVTVG
jgi:DMSO/TMAO reductase YedYZ molybdopterin-dependent catalytic subunit